MNDFWKKSRNKLFRVYNKLMQKNSNFLFRSILKTPPITTNPDADVILYSALNRVNCWAYILAAKSFLRFYSNISVVVQDDGDLDERCLSELRYHVKGITIYTRESMDLIIQQAFSEEVKKVMPPASDCISSTPVKILYLKLFNVIARFQKKKVIFVDSDMIFLKRPDAIIDWIIEPYKRDFYSGGGSFLAKTFHDIGFEFKTLDISNFNSGLLGIGGSISQDKLAEVLLRIREYDPSIFYEWEIEQSVWSVLLSERQNPLNIDGLRELYIGSGWKTYARLREKAIVAHFVGAIRFKNFRYLRLARDVIKQLNYGANCSDASC